MVTETANSETAENNGCLGLQGGRIEELSNWYRVSVFQDEMAKRVNFMFFHHIF